MKLPIHDVRIGMEKKSTVISQFSALFLGPFSAMDIFGIFFFFRIQIKRLQLGIKFQTCLHFERQGNENTMLNLPIACKRFNASINCSISLIMLLLIILVHHTNKRDWLRILLSRTIQHDILLDRILIKLHNIYLFSFYQVCNPKS